MFIVLGATGHVGFATAQALLGSGEPVIAVTRDSDKAQQLKRLGADIAEADVYDVDGMRAVFRRGKRLFLLNPPAAPNTDTDAVETKTGRLLLQALDGSGIERVVLQSTYGAQEGAQIGDLGTLYTLEQALKRQPIPVTIIRAAFYMSNWDMLLEGVRNDGVLPTMYPADLKIPMVAPADIGTSAAKLLQEPASDSGIHFIEGPERYSPTDVANAFAGALGKPVKLAVTAREQWEAAYLKLGFSQPAAKSYARMTAVSVDGGYELPAAPTRGVVTLQAYIEALVAGR